VLDDYYKNVMEFKIQRAKERYQRQRQFGRKTLLARDAKIKSRECLEEMCRQTGVTIEEVLSGTRYTPVVDVRTRWCVITRELLINHMSEVEIARWMEIPRVTMKVACDRWGAEQKIERENRLWKTLARNHLEQQKINQVKPPYQVEIVLSPPDRRRFDIDNRAKVVLDILEDVGYIENDCFVNDIRITRTEPNKENPCATFMVKHIEEQE
jgi:crossover junction endodeoxyribonuclease RusA